MTDVLACKYRYVRETGKEDNPLERVVLEPGDKASNLPADVRKELKAQGLVVDEKLLDSNNNRIPGAVAVGSDNDSDDEEKKAPAKKTTASSGSAS